MNCLALADSVAGSALTSSDIPVGLMYWDSGCYSSFAMRSLDASSMTSWDASTETTGPASTDISAGKLQNSTKRPAALLAYPQV
ncbi:hypothetical protein V6N13_063556 [Hibiscus sabdariffa]